MQIAEALRWLHTREGLTQTAASKREIAGKGVADAAPLEAVVKTTLRLLN